ncbi:9342_t:CDS:1 [Ambispora gerdemannii]|uniref:9342_t:CDS:1 n=1 Tax=Ambispora gerdemannii TaxID=144530 RepID=A0A9N9C6H0_9GLOM|nr:9342_t:CDS:1 [Ambispora gerdemannii]
MPKIGITHNWQEKYNCEQDFEQVHLSRPDIENKGFTEWQYPENWDNGTHGNNYVHISTSLSISNAGKEYTRSDGTKHKPNLARILEKIDYARKAKMKGVIIHCGSKNGKDMKKVGKHGKKKKVPITQKEFDDNWKQIINNNEAHGRNNPQDKVKIFVENSASKNCYGAKWTELRKIAKEPNVAICIDTMHWFATGNSWEELYEATKDNKVQLFYLNDIPHAVTLGSGIDRYEQIGKGQLPVSVIEHVITQGKDIIIETPNPWQWGREILNLRK